MDHLTPVDVTAGTGVASEHATQSRKSDRDDPGVLHVSTTALLESAPDATVVVDEHGRIVLVNAHAERLFGFTREQLVGRPVELLVPAGDEPAHELHRTAFAAQPHRRAMGFGADLLARRSDGSQVPVEISLSPLETPSGTLVIAAVRDVSERRALAQRLRAANAELVSASHAKDRFIASISHELRTPLTAILGFTGTLLMGLSGPLTEEQQRRLGSIQDSGRHLLSLINDLLDVARLQSGSVTFQAERIDCGALVEEVVAGLQPLAEEKGIALTLSIEDATDIECDRRALLQILINLTANAIKFTDRGEVSVALRRERPGGHEIAVFAVNDTGRGIRPEDRERLFDAFEQGASATGGPREGTGLGLYIAQALAASIGASIAVTSEVGMGSTFTVEIPALAGPAGA